MNTIMTVRSLARRGSILFTVLSIAVAMGGGGSLRAEDLTVSGQLRVGGSTTLSSEVTVGQDLNVTGSVDIGGSLLNLGTNSATSSIPGLSIQYSDTNSGALTTVTFAKSGSVGSWVWEQGVVPQMTLTGTNSIILWNPSASQSAGIVLNPNPAGSSTFSGSIIVNGTNNQLPNQSVIGSASIVTKGYADANYAPIGSGILSSTNGGAVNTSWNGGSITTQGATGIYWTWNENLGQCVSHSTPVAGGHINLSACGAGGTLDVDDENAFGMGGSIEMVGGQRANAGSINLSAGYDSSGGSIIMRGGYSPAGSINLSGAYGGGGSIDLSGGEAAGGSISAKGSKTEFGGSGGYITMNGGIGYNSNGGYIELSGGSGAYALGGSIYAKGGTGEEAMGGSFTSNGGSSQRAWGGSLDMSGGTYAGGSIDTSNGGASLSTRNFTAGQALVAQADGTDWSGRTLYTFKPTTIPLLTGNQTYTGANTFGGNVIISGTNSNLVAQGRDNQLPNQVVTNSASIVTKGYADSHYVSGKNFVVNSLSGVSIGGGTASGEGSLAVGVNTASGLYAVAMTGMFNRANGNYSLAVGEDAVSDGAVSFAMGSSVRSSGFGAFATGRSTTASGQDSVAMGEGTQANGAQSMAIGYYTVATGANSVAMGQETYADGERSLAVGWRTLATGANSVAMGSCTTATGSNQLVVGQANNVVSDALFVVGNGTLNPYGGADTYTNALVVKSNGDTAITGTATVSGGLNVTGATTLTGTTTLSSTYIPRQGDLSMGTFTASPTVQGQ